MAFNPWLITWEIFTPSNGVPKNLIAGILTSEAGVCAVMQVCYNGFGGYLSDQLNGARKGGWQVRQRPNVTEYEIGGSPMLYGRKVWNFEVTRDEQTGNEVATWEDRSVDLNERGDPTGFWTVRKKTYDKAKNEIECAMPVKVAIPPRKVRK